MRMTTMNYSSNVSSWLVADQGPGMGLWASTRVSFPLRKHPFPNVCKPFEIMLHLLNTHEKKIWVYQRPQKCISQLILKSVVINNTKYQELDGRQLSLKIWHRSERGRKSIHLLLKQILLAVTQCKARAGIVQRPLNALYCVEDTATHVGLNTTQKLFAKRRKLSIVKV